VTLDQLRIFLAVAEREHVTRAAEALHLTQSAVSGAIHALEERHGVRLFHRVGRGIQLTAEGRAFVSEARAILALVRNAENTLADLSGVKRGVLSIFASQTTASYWLPQHLVRFRERYPGIDLQLEIGNTAQCVRSVLTGAADLGFIEGAVEEPSLRTETVARDRLLVVVGRDHSWVGRPPTSPVELSQTEWALREPGSGTRSTFEEALRNWGVEPDALTVAMQLPSNEAICTAVEMGHLAAAVSEYVARAGMETGRLVPLSFEFPVRDLSMIQHQERHPGQAAKTFAQMIREASLL